MESYLLILHLIQERLGTVLLLQADIATLVTSGVFYVRHFTAQLHNGLFDLFPGRAVATSFEVDHGTFW